MNVSLASSLIDTAFLPASRWLGDTMSTSSSLRTLDRPQGLIVGLERYYPELDLTCRDLFRDTARNAALDLDLYERVFFAKLLDHRQQVKDGVLIGRDRYLAVLQVADLGKRSSGVGAEVEHLLGVIEQHLSGEGQCTVLRRSVKKRLADVVLKPPDRLADRGLRPVKYLRRTRKTAFPRDRD